MIHPTPYVIPVILAAGISLMVSWYIWKNRSVVSGSKSFVVFLVLGAITSLFYSLFMSITDEIVQRYLLDFMWFGILFSSVSLLVSILQYRGKDRWISKKYILPLVAVGFVFIGSAFTDTLGFHNLFRTNVEQYTDLPFSSVSVTYNYLGTSAILYAFSLFFLSTYQIFEMIMSSRDMYRMQAVSLAVAVLVPWISSIMSILKWPHPALNLTPFAYLISGILIAWALFRYDFLNLIPIARNTVVENMRDIVIVTDRNGRIIDMNTAAEDAVSGEGVETIGENISDVLEKHLSDVDGSEFEFEQEFNSKSNSEIVLEVDDELRHFDTELSPLLGTAGNVRGKTFVFRDISDIKEREEELRKREEELREKNERLDSFADVVAHDIRNPMGIASAHLELEMERRQESEDAIKNLQKIEDSLRRMDDLIDDLLILARQGEKVGETEEVEVDKTVRLAWSNVDTQGLELELEKDLPTLEADENRLIQAFENLIRNTREHAGEATEIRVGPLENRNGIYFEDDGEGIPESKAENIFEQGYTTSHDGTGLGLSIVKNSIEAHDWEISVSESKKGGVRFEITGIESANYD